MLAKRWHSASWESREWKWLTETGLPAKTRCLRQRKCPQTFGKEVGELATGEEKAGLEAAGKLHDPIWEILDVPFASLS